MGRASGRRGEEVEHEVAVGDGVDRVRRHAGEAELARDEPAVGREVDACERACPERELAGRAQHELEASRVAPEHPEVREQVVRQVHGLRALEMRVARHRPVLVALGERDEHALQTLELLERLQRVRASEHRHVGRDLVVARARGVQLAADRPDDLRQPALDRHVDVLVVVAEGEATAVHLLRHPLEPAEQRVAVGLADDPGRSEHPRVGARLLDVVGPEAPVEPDRGVQLAEDPVLGLREARHMGIMPAMEVVVRAARPSDPADGLLFASAAPYYAAYAGGERRARRLLDIVYPAHGPHGELGGLPRRRARRPRGRGARRLPGGRERRAGAPVRAAHAAALGPLADPGADAPPARDRGDRAVPPRGRALRRRARH
jgi:hypothetical protein